MMFHLYCLKVFFEWGLIRFIVKWKSNVLFSDGGNLPVRVMEPKVRSGVEEGNELLLVMRNS